MYSECDTLAVQENGQIIISNSMHGNQAGLYVGPIRTTSGLSLAVQCTYSDQITIDLDLSVDDADFAGQDAGDESEVNQIF